MIEPGEGLNISALVEGYLLQAEAQQGLGNTGEAANALEQALAIAEPAGYRRTILDQGEPIQKLLVRSRRSPYINGLIAQFHRDDPQPPAQLQPLIDPLSERELEVLRLLPTNLTTPEMAAELYISVSTVRSHIKSIYSKLDVHRRSEAVNRAEELGLL